MNIIKSIITITAILLSATAFAQSKTDKIKVSGNCGMCAKKIETAAKDAGASEATWDKKKKVLLVKYDAANTSNDAIQKNVADAGYDTEKYTADMEVYNNLHECCKYDNKRKK
jgi:copper chaperone CopZ